MTTTILDKLIKDPKTYSFDVDVLGECKMPSPVRHHAFIPEGGRIFLSEDAEILNKLREKLGREPSFERAGPHEKIFHNLKWTRVGILTAGGLCPGLNNVIKGLVEILSFDYGIQSICGIRYGYAGLVSGEVPGPIMLNPDVVDTIHEKGGTILGSSRGQQSTDDLVDSLVHHNINILFCVGGDGSLRCAHEIAETCKARHLAISVVGVPKTIDNDLMFVGPSFGFETAVAEATKVIQNAHVEAKGTLNGVGLVKLMGRDSGFITAYAALANPVVNFCLIPEVDFELQGEHGLLKAIERRFDKGKGHTVIVVAEGAGQHLMEGKTVRDASGNILKKDIGEFLRQEITEYFKARNYPCSVKYFDPSYMIRSVPARGTDAIRCYMLARNAVHAAMAGRTNCVVGTVGDSYTLVPIRLATIERQQVQLDGDLWRSVMDATGQEVYFSGDNRSETLAP